jgi:hypothetical protein
VIRELVSREIADCGMSNPRSIHSFVPPGLTFSNSEADDAIPIAECGTRIAEWKTYAPFPAWVDLGWVGLWVVHRSRSRNHIGA